MLPESLETSALGEETVKEEMESLWVTSKSKKTWCASKLKKEKKKLGLDRQVKD